MGNNVDFQIVLLRYINSLKLPLVARLDYFTEQDDLVVNAISGGRVNRVYMDYTREVSLPFEVAVKSLDQQLANDIIWTIQSKLSDFDLELPSQNNSYQFLNLIVDNPSVVGRDEQGFFVFNLNLIANLDILYTKENK